MVLLLARWCRAGPGLAAALCGVALVGFVILVRPSPSVLRAAAMGGLGLLALASGRSRAAVPALASAVVVLILADPGLAGDAGFALSVFATGGLLLLAPAWRDGAAFLSWLASWPARWLVAVGRYGAHAPDGVFAWPGGTGGALLLALLLLVALWAVRRPWVRAVVGVCAVAAAVGAVPVQLAASGWPPSGALAIMCDVGQGDAVAVPVGPGQALVVDAGAEPGATDRCLTDLGVREVPLLVLSHFHADHVGGVAGVFRGRRVGEVATSPLPEPAEGRTRVLAAAAAAGTPVIVPPAGWTWSAGPVRLTVVGPTHVISGSGSDPNSDRVRNTAHRAHSAQAYGWSGTHNRASGAPRAPSHGA